MQVYIGNYIQGGLHLCRKLKMSLTVTQKFGHTFFIITAFMYYGSPEGDMVMEIFFLNAVKALTAFS